MNQQFLCGKRITTSFIWNPGIWYLPIMYVGSQWPPWKSQPTMVNGKIWEYPLTCPWLKRSQVVLLRLAINKILLYYKSYTAHKLLIFMSGNLRREISLLLDKYSRFVLAIAFGCIFTTLNLLSNQAFFSKTGLLQ